MGFFSLEKKPVGEGAFETIIGEKARFKGELSSPGSVSISGGFEGKISVEGDLIIAPGSKIAGEVRGGTVVVSGRVDGNITALHTLEITRSGRVHGDLTGGKIVIEEGSSYRGKVKVETGREEELVEEEKEEVKVIKAIEEPVAEIQPQPHMFQDV